MDDADLWKANRFITKEENSPVEPKHYQVTINGNKVECLEIIEELGMNLNRGSAFQYIWRAGIKNKDTYLEDLKKARFYLDREISRHEKK